MQVKFGNETYDVRFKKVQASFLFLRRKPTDEKSTSQMFDTVCCISTVDPNKTGKDRFNGVAQAVAYQSPKDKYNRFTGKKLALTRALQKQMFSRQARRVFWLNFFAKYPQAK